MKDMNLKIYYAMMGIVKTMSPEELNELLITRRKFTGHAFVLSEFKDTSRERNPMHRLVKLR